MEEVPKILQLETPAQIMRRTDGVPVAELPIEFKWVANDPFAITMTFTGAEDEEPVAWIAGADLFIGALIDRGNGWHGEGDVSVRFFENVCYIALTESHAGDEGAVAKMSAVGLAPYIHRVARLRVMNKEYINFLVNKELDALLTEEDA